jgi:hypothetical protein
MNIDDAVFDYSNAFDISPYINNIKNEWNNSQEHAEVEPNHRLWNGSPLEDTTPPAGWDLGMWKTHYNIRSKFITAKELVDDVIERFNLPPTDPCWYQMWRHSKDAASFPLTLIPALQGWDPRKVCLSLVIQGSLGDKNSITYFPEYTDTESCNNYYGNLHNMNTKPEDYTNPPNTGPQYAIEGNIILMNWEVGWQPTPTVLTKDIITVKLSWTDYKYSQIKKIMDKSIYGE